jgi:GH3 auxin-responsive promoter
MSFVVKVAAFVTRRQWARWEERTREPQAIQERLLLDLVRHQRATAFGRDHCFDAVHSIADYRQRIPIGDYERLRPYVERAERGEASVLTAEPVLMFNLTSGSTGAPKLIPVTETVKRHHRELTRLWYYRAYVDHCEFLNHHLLGVVSPVEEGRTSSGIPYGAASGLIFQSSPSWIQNAYATPYETARIKNFEAKYYVVMRLALERKISFIGAPNPSTILKLLESADRHKADIIREIADGTLDARWDIPADVRHTIPLKKNPARARQLEKFAGRSDRLRPEDYWPELKLIGCWKGGSVGVRLQEFSRWFDTATPVRDLGYMASEAQITLPITDHGSAGILDISANFYEFIPAREIGNSNAEPLGCADLQEGEEYYLILTTPAGLYRYDINDVVRVAGFYNQTPLLEFARKGRDVTSITGEKLHVNQMIEAIHQAQAAVGLAVQHFHAAADAANSRYILAVECDGAAPSREFLASFLREVDVGLRRLNIEYAQKRDSQRLAAPILWLMRSGWYARKTEAALTRAGRDAQFKPPLLDSTLEPADEAMLVVECDGRSALLGTAEY